MTPKNFNFQFFFNTIITLVQTEFPSITYIFFINWFHLTFLTRFLVNMTFSRTRSSINQGVGLHVALLKKPKSKYIAFQQSKQQALRTYCPNIYCVPQANQLKSSQFFFVSGKKPDEYNCSVEYYECVCILVASPSSPFQTYSLT